MVEHKVLYVVITLSKSECSHKHQHGEEEVLRFPLMQFSCLTSLTLSYFYLWGDREMRTHTPQGKTIETLGEEMAQERHPPKARLSF